MPPILWTQLWATEAVYVMQLSLMILEKQNLGDLAQNHLICFVLKNWTTCLQNGYGICIHFSQASDNCSYHRSWAGSDYLGWALRKKSSEWINESCNAMWPLTWDLVFKHVCGSSSFCCSKTVKENTYFSPIEQWHVHISDSRSAMTMPCMHASNWPVAVTSVLYGQHIV